ncbi:MAG: DUF45 domain-containing protein [Corynebacterium sp.]|nr:DUF45 domain-containing protein [Corynebacterium sp.]
MKKFWDSERIVRSTRRKKSAGARVRDGVLEFIVPDWYTAEQVEYVVPRLRKQLTQKLLKKYPPVNLEERADYLNHTYLEGRASFQEIIWVNNQNRRWGSCSRFSGRIRMNSRLQHTPGFVIDQVLIHELVHTFVPGGHSEEFYRWAKRAPHYERAQGYLEAFGEWYNRQPLDEDSTLPSFEPDWGEPKDIFEGDHSDDHSDDPFDGLSEEDKYLLADGDFDDHNRFDDWDAPAPDPTKPLNIIRLSTRDNPNREP